MVGRKAKAVLAGVQMVNKFVDLSGKYTDRQRTAHDPDLEETA